MVDIRRDVCGILVGGSPAPGVNGVISAMVIRCLEIGIVPIGFMHGFKHLKHGVSTMHIQLKTADVSRVHNRGGSILCTSKQQLTNQTDLENTIRALQFLRVRYFVTIGGTETAFSAHRLARAAVDSKANITIVHVPKTIFNDLPLPDNCYTFGFSTARELGVQLVSNLSTDAKTMNRWYIITIIGARTGHLALGIGAASAATLTLIPELYKEGLEMKEILDTIDATMIKRAATGKEYGIVILNEGLVDLLNKNDLEKYFDNNIDRGHSLLSHKIVESLDERWRQRKMDVYLRPKFLGFELRGADPNAHDVILARELGYAAVSSFRRGINATIVTMKGGDLSSIPLSEMVDPDTDKPAVKTVSLKSLSFQVAMSYMIRLYKTDLSDKKKLKDLSKIANISENEFTETYNYIAVNN